MKKLIILIIFITGCRYTELNNVSIIKSIGISYQDNSYTLYAQLINVDDKEKSPKTDLIIVNAKSFNMLFDKLKKEINKDVFYAHIDLMLIDFTIQDKNYQDIIQYFINNNDFRNDFVYVLTSDIEKALVNSRYNEIEELIKNNNKTINISFEKVINLFLNDKVITLSDIEFNQKVVFDCNYSYFNNNYERTLYEET